MFQHCGVCSSTVWCVPAMWGVFQHCGCVPALWGVFKPMVSPEIWLVKLNYGIELKVQALQVPSKNGLENGSINYRKYHFKDLSWCNGKHCYPSMHTAVAVSLHKLFCKAQLAYDVMDNIYYKSLNRSRI